MRLKLGVALGGLLTLGIAALPRPAPLPEAPTDCGDPTAPVPTISLLDVNPSSPTFGQRMGPSEFLGKVVVIYFATAS
ncbi:MAG: hypothetical protein H6741_06905 [Alphaproteobacteria bacterium]|nr:hypothetical protein [Alphaproteobacteria bacterium]